jgi:hypothetical protein
MRHRPVVVDHPSHQQPPAMNRQPGITVKHEDLRAVKN